MHKKHDWPTRWNARRDRYEVRIKGRWVSRQRAFVVLRSNGGAARRKAER